ncbi:MAG: 2-succinyl-5-enolpyruvyl-6-hydroxy-3-cyclohexene-1-carboxylate synthase, partial [Deltaproteobacteria bacterium]
HVRVARDAAAADPSGAVTWGVDADLEGLLACLPAGAPDPRVSAWRERSAQLEAALDARPTAPLTEEQLARLISRAAPDGGALFVGNSMPIRDLDRWSASDGPSLVVGANRGASGIDGLIATACGFSRGLGRPTLLVLGDQSFAHDVGGLAVLAEVAPDLTVLVVNNGGGHIFDRLPIARHPELLERWFTAPQRLSIASACSAFGVDHAGASTLAEVQRALVSGAPGPRVIEVSAPPAERQPG